MGLAAGILEADVVDARLEVPDLERVFPGHDGRQPGRHRPLGAGGGDGQGRSLAASGSTT